MCYGFDVIVGVTATLFHIGTATILFMALVRAIRVMPLSPLVSLSIALTLYGFLGLIAFLFAWIWYPSVVVLHSLWG